MPKFIPFEDVEELATIEQLAQMLNLQLQPSKTQLRGVCPIHGGGDRTLCISPGVRSKRGSLGVFYCQASQLGGDRIGLVAHCMEMEQQEAAFFINAQFGTGTVGNSTENSTVTVSKSRANEPEPAKPVAPAHKFDPEKFGAKLVWHEEVKALGLTEEEAARLGVGFHPQRKAVFFPIRNPDHSISGFIGCDAAKMLKLPPEWLPDSDKVVRLKRA
jgi:hypothetical protein